MLSKIKSFCSRFRRNEDGVTLVEYGIAVGVAVIVGGVLIGTVATHVNTNLNAADSALTLP